MKKKSILYVLVVLMIVFFFLIVYTNHFIQISKSKKSRKITKISDFSEFGKFQNSRIVKNSQSIYVPSFVTNRLSLYAQDFKNIRQMHILDPWYNFNRQEQTIGRAVRNFSHCALPYIEKNVELY